MYMYVFYLYLGITRIKQKKIICILDHFCSWVSQVLVPIFDNDENLVRIPECVAYGNDVCDN